VGNASASVSTVSKRKRRKRGNKVIHQTYIWMIVLLASLYWLKNYI